MHHSAISDKKARALKLAKQSRGTFEKLITMIEEDAYCPEIIQQADSVIGLVRSAKRELLAGHLDTCAIKKLKENKKQAIDELMKIYRLSE